MERDASFEVRVIIHRSSLERRLGTQEKGRERNVLSSSAIALNGSREITLGKCGAR